MAVPSRVFVGLTVFGLVCSVLSVAAVVVTFTCKEVDQGPGIDIGQAKCAAISLGTKLFLSLASLFCVTFTIMAWRSLLAGARRDRALRQAIKERAAKGPEAPPPGYQ